MRRPPIRIFRFKRMAFGDAMKYEVAAAYGIESARLHEQEFKDQHRAPDGRLWRQVLKDHGMKRRAEDTNYWVEKLRPQLLAAPLTGNPLFVISDVRFHSEVALVRVFGGKIWHARRVFAEEQAAADSHVSEHELDGTPADRDLWNVEGDSESLHRAIKLALATGDDVPPDRLLISRLAALPKD